MGQEVLDAFWKIQPTESTMRMTLLYHRLARSCGLSDCAFWLLYTLRAEEAPSDPDPAERAAVPAQADGEFRPEKAGGGGISSAWRRRTAI